MPIAGNLRLTLIQKNGASFRVPAEGEFYIRFLLQSQFHARVATLADRIEMMIKERGPQGRFDRKKFYEAAGLCVYAHRDMRREVSGLPYADHPISLVEREVDILHVTDGEELIAGLLHDVEEDTEFDLKFIKRRFGGEVANLVDGMTKIKQLEGDKGISEENIDKFIAALVEDIRVLRIKMVDRGVNLEDAERRSDESRTRNCAEALDLYVPLGILCGFMKASRHLADIAFKKLNPGRYREIEETIGETVRHNRELLDSLASKIAEGYRQKLRANYPSGAFDPLAARRYLSAKSVEVLDKPRTAQEVDQSAVIRGADPRNLSDVLMMQVMVDTEQDCYEMAEVIHSSGTPINDYWRDFIKDPKINRYQSLHTAIFAGDVLVRFQIRTRKMQRVSQEGVLYDAYTLSGKFKQPELPVLKKDWLKIILGVKDRRGKILLVRSLARARRATVVAESPSARIVYDDVLLPRGVTPLEMAFIADPMLGLCFEQAFFHDVPLDANESMKGATGLTKIKVGGAFQYRDYLRLLSNPLARLKLFEFLKSRSDEYRIDFVSRVLESELSGIFLRLEDLHKFASDEARKILLRMAGGEITAGEAVSEIGKIAKMRTDRLTLERLELTGENRAQLYQAANTLREIGLVEGSSIQGLGAQEMRLKLSLAPRSLIQQAQIANFTADVRRREEARITFHDQITPPVIDDLSLDPRSLYYSQDLALRAAKALQEQRGQVFDLYLNPMAMEIVPPERMPNAMIAEHLAGAGLLFFSGAGEAVAEFRARLPYLIDERLVSLPLMVVFERRGMHDVEAVVSPLRELAEIPTLSVTEIGHSTEFILACLRRRFG